MSICGFCKIKVGRNDINKVECSQCKTLFHANCVKINPSDVEFLSKESAIWKCHTCENFNRKSRLINSPPLSPRNAIINTNSQPTSKISVVPNMNNNNTKEITCTDSIILQKLINIENHNKVLNENIIKLNSELINTLSIVQELQTTILNLQSDISINKNELLELTNAISKNKEICAKSHYDTNNRIDFLEKQYVKNNIEIHGVPYKKNEIVRDIVLKILNDSLNLSIDHYSIDHCYRISSKKRNNMNGSNSSNIDSPIFVRFTSFDIKSLIINKKFELKPKIKSNILFPDSNNNIYINDCLTVINKKIFHEAKKLKVEKKFKYLWVRNNTIMLRYTDGDKIIYIKSLNDLENLSTNE